MLSKLIKNSDNLIKRQFNDNQDLKDEILKIKTKHKNNSFFQSSKIKTSIFAQPQFLQKIDLKKLKRSHKIQFALQTYRIRSQSHRIKKSPQQTKLHTLKHQTPQQQDLKISIGSQQLSNKHKKIIHSLNSTHNIKPKLIPSPHKKTSQKFSLKYKKALILQPTLIIEQPGFTNLCFYKNKLQQLQKIKTQRISQTRNHSSRKQKIYKQKNKIKFHKFNHNHNINEQQISQCRPWSTGGQNQIYQSQFLLFKSLLLKNN